MGSYFRAGDTISGQEAVATMTVHNADGTDTIEELFYGKSLDAKVELNKTDVKTLGKRGTQHKPAGWSGSGSLTVYYASSAFRKVAMQYIKTGVPTYFDILVTNEDPGSQLGKQVVNLKDCTINSVSLAKFDVEQDVLDESLEFTFDDVELMEEFSTPDYI